jgi:hypothetical protein
VAGKYRGKADRLIISFVSSTDAVPKKRGPKTDVLEALLKRVDGLEARLKEQKNSDASPTMEDAPTLPAEDATSAAGSAVTSSSAVSEPRPKRPALETHRTASTNVESAIYSPTVDSEPSPGVQLDALLDTYFNRFHAKPFHILDESSIRQRLQLEQLPDYLVHAIYAVAARYRLTSSSLRISTLTLFKIHTSSCWIPIGRETERGLCRTIEG